MLKIVKKWFLGTFCQSTPLRVYFWLDAKTLNGGIPDPCCFLVRKSAIFRKSKNGRFLRIRHFPPRVANFQAKKFKNECGEFEYWNFKNPKNTSDMRHFKKSARCRNFFVVAHRAWDSFLRIPEFLVILAQIWAHFSKRVVAKAILTDFDKNRQKSLDFYPKSSRGLG